MEFPFWDLRTGDRDYALGSGVHGLRALLESGDPSAKNVLLRLRAGDPLLMTACNEDSRDGIDSGDFWYLLSINRDVNWYCKHSAGSRRRPRRQRGDAAAGGGGCGGNGKLEPKQ